jgi:hydrogenase maturation protease
VSGGMLDPRGPRGLTWEELERPGPDSVTVRGVELRAGSRVLLHPRAGGDVLDLALSGKVAVVEGIEQDLEDNLQLAVVLEDDPGRDLGERRQPGHRFFFSLGEVEPLSDEPGRAPARHRVLVAGIGNVFLGDDGFGVEAAGRLAQRKLPAGVDVVDFGIRGMDLAYALQDGYDAAIFIDATPRGERPGTLLVIEPELAGLEAVPEAHGMDPVKVLALARELGGLPDRVLVVGCEPQAPMGVDDEDLRMELSEPVRGALDEAVRLVESLIENLMQSGEDRKEGAEHGQGDVAGAGGGSGRRGGGPDAGDQAVHEDQADVGG